jgi:hypothetical protein
MQCEQSLVDPTGLGLPQQCQYLQNPGRAPPMKAPEAIHLRGTGNRAKAGPVVHVPPAGHPDAHRSVCEVRRRLIIPAFRRSPSRSHSSGPTRRLQHHRPASGCRLFGRAVCGPGRAALSIATDVDVNRLAPVPAHPVQSHPRLDTDEPVLETVWFPSSRACGPYWGRQLSPHAAASRRSPSCCWMSTCPRNSLMAILSPSASQASWPRCPAVA